MKSTKLLFKPHVADAFRRKASELLASHDILFVGDCHTSERIKKLMFDSSLDLRKSNVKLCFLEMVSVAGQSTVDLFHQSPGLQAKFLDPCFSNLRSHSEQMPQYASNVMALLKMNSIRPVGLQQDGAFEIPIKQQNEFWAERIIEFRNYLREGEKSVVYAGASHTGKENEDFYRLLPNHSRREYLHDPIGIDGLLRMRGIKIASLVPEMFLGDDTALIMKDSDDDKVRICETSCSSHFHYYLPPNYLETSYGQQEDYISQIKQEGSKSREV